MQCRKILLATTAIFCGANGAIAQDQTNKSGDNFSVADIIVTAERRETSLQKSALNVTVLGSDALSTRGIGDSRSMLDSVPGLKMTVANPNAYIGLYGLASGSGTQYSDAVMGFNYGGVPLARQTSAASSYYDLERVEILKGPQGTLYGRNATVGAINLLPARPTHDREGAVSVTVGNYDTLNTTGHFNLPLSDTLSSRLAFQTTQHDGYFTNGLDDAKNYGLRGSMLFEPSSDLSIFLFADAYFNRSRGPYSTWRYYLGSDEEWIDPDNPWFGLGAAGTCSNQLFCPSFAAISAGGVNSVANPQGFTNVGANGYGNTSVYGTDGRNNADQFILSSEIRWRTGIGTVTIQPAWVHTKIDYLTYSNGLRFSNLTKADQTSLEARLASDGDGRLRWVIGGFLFHEHQDAFLNNLQSTGYAILRTPNLVDDNAAAFADATFSLTESLRLTGGLRYTHEKKSQDGYTTASGLSASDVTTIEAAGGDCTTGGTPANPILYDGQYYFPSNFCVIANSGRYKEDNLSWKAGIEFDPRPGSMLYANVRTGFRAGGFTVGTQNDYKPEKLTAYEIGSKNRFFDGRLQANLSAFYWRYKNQQISQLQLYYLNGIAIGQTSYPSNFDGNLYGAELDLQAAVTPNDRLNLDILFAEGKYDQTPPVATVNSSALTPQYDLPRINLPKWSISGGYSHRFDLANGGNISASVRAHYESKAWLRIIDPALLTKGDLRDAYVKTDADLTYNAPNDRWSIQLFVQNLTNEAVVGVGASGQTALGTFFRPSSNPLGHRSATLDPPRTWGVRMSAKF